MNSDIIQAYNKGQSEWEILGVETRRFEIMIVDLNNPNDLTKEHTIGIYEFIHNPKYAVIETLSKDEKIVKDFESKYNFHVPMLLNGLMLKGYWEEYIVSKLNTIKE